MSKNSKGFLEMPFSWLFAIITGIFILFFAFYFGSSLLKTGNQETSAKSAKQIQGFLNSIENGLESSQTSSISMPSDTRIKNICENTGVLGKERISVEQKTFGKWSESDVKISANNKYLFSNRQIEAKNLNIFSKPLKFSFSVGSLIYIIPKDKEYCFINAPSNLKGEINELGLSNLKIGDCNGTKVCFNRGNCDIIVDYSSNSIRKGNETFYFALDPDDSLFYAALFSDKGVYECQLKRVIERAKILTKIYLEKQELLKNYCEDYITNDLTNMYNILDSYNDSRNLNDIILTAQELDNSNKFADCRLW
jgi:hypothetical protein